MNLEIEGWEPTTLEKSLMDGSFDKALAEREVPDIPDIPDDLLEVQEFEEAMEDLRKEIASWQ